MTRPAWTGFLKTWATCFGWLFVVPAVLVYVLGAISYGQMLALVPAYFLAWPGALLVGAPHYSPEVFLPVTTSGYVITACIWLAVSGALAFALRLRDCKRAEAANHRDEEKTK